MPLQTPYYLIDERALLANLKKIDYLRKTSGAKAVLALKCFSTPAVFKLMSEYMDGTTSSSLYEAKMGAELFGGETHAFSVAYSKEDIEGLKKFSDKIIFNSVSQLERFYKDAKNLKTGIRINPSVSYSNFDLADPARRYSRLGVSGVKDIIRILNKIDGAMFHYNCENEDFAAFSKTLDFISVKYAKVLQKVNWISLGGGIFFTKDGYPLGKLCAKLKDFSKKFGVQVYLEPGEAAITKSCELVTTVLDVVKNEKNIAIVDASTEAHALDLLIYGQQAKLSEKKGANEYIIAGRSCLAGDVFGTYKTARKLKIGSMVRFADTAGYTMVKKNWFNGLKMPSIAVKRLNGKTELIRKFSYNDFVKSLS
jgi:carboxynorspermidine decarboxylase